MNRLSLMTLAGAASLLLVSATYAQAGTDAADPAPSGDARSGRVTYMRLGCYQCHGTSGQGGGKVGPKIAPDPFSYADFLRQLRAPRAAMPVYTVIVLSDRDAANIHAYLASIPQPPTVDKLPLLNRSAK